MEGENILIKSKIFDSFRRLNGTNFKQEYLKIKRLHNEKELLKFQNENLKNLLYHAYKNVPYYHRLFKDIDLIHGREGDLSKFEKIPVLTKDIMRKHYQDLRSKDYKTRKIYYSSSGGYFWRTACTRPSSHQKGCMPRGQYNR